LIPGVTELRQARVRAPELSGDVWLNTGGERLRLAELRGRIVLLDFWTSGCINCLHVLDELRPLEEEFADSLVTIGVHSPKFLHEGEAQAIEAAVQRYDVHHPVLNDPDLTTWSQYAVKAWPTLVVIDPEGYVVHVAAGEGHAETLRRVLAELVGIHTAKGTLRVGGSPYGTVAPGEGVAAGAGRAGAGLRFPGKAVPFPGPGPDGRLLVADTGNGSVVEIAPDLETVSRRYPGFRQPAGLAVLPPTVASRVGYDVVVADTVAHRLYGLHLDSGEVTAVAGTGTQWRDGSDSGAATAVDLTSPWDVTWWEPAGGVVIAMAGNHTLGLFDPVAGTISRLAGTTVEGLRDGPADEAFFAQTSGLAAAPAANGQPARLWLADAETSALRWLERAAPGSATPESTTPESAAPGSSRFSVHTAVGVDLFTFGHRDGDAAEALLQHPLGVAVLADGSVAVADTYNGAVRRFDPATGTVGTLAADLAEPSGVLVAGDRLVVVESAAHRLNALGEAALGDAVLGDAVLGEAVLDKMPATLVQGDAHAVRRPPTDLAAGELDLTVVFVPPPGEKLDDRYGPSTRLEVSASPPELLTEGAGTGTELTRRLRLAGSGGDGTEGVLQVVAQAASCDAEGEHPVCRVARQDWGVPVRITADGSASLRLVMSGPQESDSAGAHL
jgi:thiol-disulfide isomerase/thioredoxin